MTVFFQFCYPQEIHSLRTKNSILKQDMDEISDSNEKLKEEIGEALLQTVIFKLIIIKTIKCTQSQNNLIQS